MTKTNKALIAGVSDYSPDFKDLPNVAADVREIAKVLQSKDGTFTCSDTKVLSNKQATKAAIESALVDTFDADNCDTVFAYLAGHGAVENANYYFIPCNAQSGDLEATAVSLSRIKDLFDNCQSERVFLWLDCCHSGGILKKRAVSDEDAIVKRTLEVVLGKGRIIIAACTDEQYAYEGSAHGMFTGALLEGLRGEAKSNSEVTASSLFDFIDREIGSDRQRPMLFGQMTGRIVLMHYGNSASAQTTGRKKAIRKKAKGPQSTGNWILLGNNFLDATKVNRTADGLFSVELLSKDAERDAAIQSLRPPSQYHHSDPVPFAFASDACDVEVQGLTSELSSGGQVWNLTLKPVEFRHNNQLEFTIVENDRQYTPENIAEIRAKAILLNEKCPTTRSDFPIPSLLDSQSQCGPDGTPLPCIIHDMYAACKCEPAQWREFARLSAIYLLKKIGIVEHVLDLTIGEVSTDKVPVTFRGRRTRQYANAEPAIIEVSGYCPLDDTT